MHRTNMKSNKGQYGNLEKQEVVLIRTELNRKLCAMAIDDLIINTDEVMKYSYRIGRFRAIKRGIFQIPQHKHELKTF